MEYYFTEDTIQQFITSLTNLPIRDKNESRIKIYAGKSLNKISITRLIELLRISAPRVSLDISGLDLEVIKKDKTPFTEEEMMEFIKLGLH
jgi:hypothetical protein